MCKLNSDECLNKGKACHLCKHEDSYKIRTSYFKEYEPLCPQGYKDCVCDPAYIKFYHPKWYKKLYGDMDPADASDEYCDINALCYDDEDK